MQIYYDSLEAIDRQTHHLEHELCPHCLRSHQLISHGFIYKKRAGAKPEAVGKRVFCSNRDGNTGCGRTSRLYLETTIRHRRDVGGLRPCTTPGLHNRTSLPRHHRHG
jgi:hypothetical protein